MNQYKSELWCLKYLGKTKLSDHFVLPLIPGFISVKRRFHAKVREIQTESAALHEVKILFRRTFARFNSVLPNLQAAAAIKGSLS